MDQMSNSALSLQGYYFEDLKEGTADESSNTISADDIQIFADVTGDHNPLHLNPAYAETTMFKGCIAHGMLTASFISAVIGTRMPGPGCIYLSQSLKFKAPVRAGDTVKTVCTVTSLNSAKKFAEIQTQCFVGDTMVIDGSALIMVPSRA